MGKAKTSRPAKKPAQIIQAALRAHELAMADREALDPRLPPALLDGMTADLESFGAKTSAPVQVRVQTKALTGSQDAALAYVHEVVGSIRNAISHAELGAAAARAWGVGAKMTRSVKVVRAAGELVLSRAATAKGEARAAGVLDGDLVGLRAALDALGAADDAQEKGRAAAPVATRERDAAARRMEDAVRRIAAAGRLAFVGDAAKSAAYAALWRAPRGKRAAKVE